MHKKIKLIKYPIWNQNAVSELIWEMWALLKSLFLRRQSAADRIVCLSVWRLLSFVLFKKLSTAYSTQFNAKDGN